MIERIIAVALYFGVLMLSGTVVSGHQKHRRRKAREKLLSEITYAPDPLAFTDMPVYDEWTGQMFVTSSEKLKEMQNELSKKAKALRYY